MNTAFQPKDIFMYALGAFVVTCGVVVIVILIYRAIPLTNHDAVMLALGILLGCFKDVVGYFFGSSKGSSDKTEIIKKQADNAAV